MKVDKWDENEEEFLKGDTKPCWCFCVKNLKTAALIVAIVLLYSHCIVSFGLLTWYVALMDVEGTTEFVNKELEKSFKLRCALITASVVSLIYIPIGFLLLVGILKKRLWMCKIWFYIISIGSLLDFGMLAIDQELGLAIFEIVFFLIRGYFLYIVWAYLAVAKRQIKLQQVWDDLSKSIDTTSEYALNVNEKGGNKSSSSASSGNNYQDVELEFAKGDSISAFDSGVDHGLDEDDLSHDSVMEQIKAEDEKHKDEDYNQHHHPTDKHSTINTTHKEKEHHS